LKGRAEAENLVGIYAALSGQSVAQVLKTYGGQGFGQSFKPDLADLWSNAWRRSPARCAG